ncbi:glycoside hydrolase family 13 protein [Ligilactobacillus acidipiscis]|uniref:glycoside hydrolase family 13 protein n=1 Tax=Ligilactobacillus acidipiscis TaxID=89059 RepID=UPI0022E909A8|nr:glycoside hydrolase family 13 protein [Ligilactobacillus acidipiscis]
METAALYHRPDSEMAYLKDQKHFQIRLKTKHDDVVKVELLYGDPYGTKVNEKDEGTWEYQVAEMKRVYATKQHDHWITEVVLPLRRLQYAFHVYGADGQEYLYDDRRIYRYSDVGIEKLSCFRMPYLHECDRIKTPEWVTNTVWYQIFPERFANGDPANDPKNTLEWGSKKPTPENFFGGDLQGIIDHLDYLQELGINGLYLCPIFTAYSNHKYDTIDYFNVDPAFGTKETLKELIDQAHERGMHVMLDAVFNHMGDFSMQWQDVQKYGRDSRFAKWFHIHDFPVSYEETANFEFARNLNYDVFANTPHMPKINTADPQAREYLLNVATYWIEQFDIDAWRLDVANEIDHEFWKDFYERTHALKKDFYVLGEVWHSAQEWVGHKEFDAVMNYSYTEPIIAHFVKKELTAAEMVDMLQEQLMLYRDQTNRVMFNALDTHDTERILTLCHGNKDLEKQTLAFMFTQYGAPCLYYGTEVGMDGGADPDCRKCMVWDQNQQDHEMFNFTQKLVKMRRKYSQLWSKSRLEFKSVNEMSDLIVFKRQDQDMQVDCIFNTGTQPQKYTLGENDQIILQQNVTEDGQIKPDGFCIIRIN